MANSEILRSLNQRPIAYYPVYRDITKSSLSAILLSQLMYWFSKKNKFYKEDLDIREETRLTENEFRGAKNKIKNLSFIKVTREGIPGRTYYEIDWGLYELELENAHSLNSQMCNSENNACNTKTSNTKRKAKSSKDDYDEPLGSSTDDDSLNKTKRKCPRIVVNRNKDLDQEKNKDLDPKKNKDKLIVNKSKYTHTISDLRNYNELILKGAIKHQSGSKAELDSLDKLHALFSKSCKLPYHSILIPEQYINFEWDMDTLIEVFEYHLKHSAEFNKKPAKAIGKFILSEGFNGNKSWSPLLHWHQKMNKTSANELSADAGILFKSMKKLNITGLTELDSSILNKVASDLSAMSERYLFIDGSKRTGEYPSGLSSCIAKYIKEKTNNTSFKLVYITKNGFVDEFIEVALKRNIIRKSKMKRVNGEVIHY